MLAPGSDGVSTPEPHRPQRGVWPPALEILGLWTLAVSLPLLDLLGREAPFLLHHRADALDLVLLLLAVSLGPAALLLTLEAVAGRFFGSVARQRVHRAVLVALVVVLALGVLRKLDDPLPPWLLLPAVAALAWAAAVAFDRRPLLAAACRLLALAAPIAVALFWFSPGARAARATAEPTESLPQAAPAEVSPTLVSPIVWVVFDELPLLSIVDETLAVDREAFPNLAAFADRATWYRNGTTVWSATAESMVSMLTGAIAQAKTPPTRETHPGNLLTWLGSSHEVHSLEMVTSLAPPAAVDLRPRPPRAARLKGLLSDTVIVAGHMLTPPRLSSALPPVDTRWGDFADARIVRAKSGQATRQRSGNRWDFALADARDRQFSGFLESIEPDARPGVHFLHIMLPHMPFRFLPSGRVYGGRPSRARPADAWLEDEWFAIQTYQRHMLQAAFVDRLVGDLMARLESTGLWDRAVVVITSDHGVSHWPGEDRRLPAATDHPEDILRVPLFIKAPGQVEGRIDDSPARTVDILPTIAALLGTAPLPWPHDGVPLDADRPPATTRLLRHPRGDPLVFDSELTPDPESLRRKLQLFDPQGAEWRWVRIGPFADLVGRDVGGLAQEAAASDCRAEVDQLPVLEEHDPTARYSPAFLTGAVTCDTPPPSGSHLAAALNGVIAGTTAMPAGDGSQAPFGLMTAEAALRPGRNRLELLLFSGAQDSPRIQPVELATAGGD